jgi:hypothetical protein
VVRQKGRSHQRAARQRPRQKHQSNSHTLTFSVEFSSTLQNTDSIPRRLEYNANSYLHLSIARTIAGIYPPSLLKAHRPQTLRPTSRSHRYQLPNPYLSQFLNPPSGSSLPQHRVECSDESVNLDCRPSNLAVGLFTHTMPCHVSNCRNKFSMCQRRRHPLGFNSTWSSNVPFQTCCPCLYDCLPIEERIGSVFGTLRHRQRAQVACKYYQNMQ